MRKAYTQYLKSTNKYLTDCYTTCSGAKMQAYGACMREVYKYSGINHKIVTYNRNIFTFGFIGKINDKEAFFFITPTKDSFIYTDEI